MSNQEWVSLILAGITLAELILLQLSMRLLKRAHKRLEESFKMNDEIMKINSELLDEIKRTTANLDNSTDDLKRLTAEKAVAWAPSGGCG